MRRTSNVQILLMLIGAMMALALFGCSKGSSTGDDSVKGGPAAEAIHLGGQDLHQSMERGNATECKNNLSQLRMAIQMERDSNDGKPPASLDALGPADKAIETCPDTNKEYQYDPASGRVWCTTPGHEKF